MLSYQWPFRGQKLIQILNYANSFAFMLYGWDAGEKLWMLLSCCLANEVFIAKVSSAVSWPIHIS